ncbi:hypothetical protein HNQ02_002032 [Flavobacterium sp. 7E]|uniref:hypothetical protein n=1 Tax=Flavobacterium sp. 7E TaxID=2735898 RepID=UPI00156EE869|nr:hypothetical protein [Flavobacterium sp. 7E]NRS89110.1 hypothetical protein [Flavobacterium sp. 7E]
MQQKLKLKIIKRVIITLLVVYIPFILFYLGIVFPEYLACVNYEDEGISDRNNWGYENPCFGENKYIGESIFELFSLLILGFTVVLGILFHTTHQLKKN